MIEVKVECFNLKATLECGQCFRWKKIDENEYIGVIKDRVIRVKQIGDILKVWSNNEKDLKNVVINYFSLDKDYKKIEKEISCIDNNIQNSLKNSSGLRHLNQDFFECLISYIISANNNIPRISKSVNEISKRYGKKVMFENEEYYLFPTINELKDVTIEDYRNCGVGFRDKYLYSTVNMIINDNIELEKLKKYDTLKLKKILLSFKGVGNKVADCILLFSCGKSEVFPIDVWVEKVMKKLYFDNKEDVTKAQILEYACTNFKQYSGIVQQHLFYNIRENMI